MSRHLPPCVFYGDLGFCQYFNFRDLDVSNELRYEKESILNLSSVCLITEF